ncbi:Initiation factor 2B-related,Methylthioribose-1-phosphate isomerase-like, N-terminal domain [Cinara cedri]|uniref:Translation initiation factor eIF2B subunit delta n=1 Tax=Cinara cedri TaxID=506608 RepID=A0A5E4NN31_9HEMI|nr:Initiation factor 2B-related,Methylthioribose-1-phosphate isomerase-like, N-terminal domain [Cinara cedri]
MDKKKPTEEKTREEVEAERKAKRAAKQERKKAALEKHKSDEPDSLPKPKDRSLEPSKKVNTNELVKEPKPEVSKAAFKKSLVQIADVTPKTPSIKKINVVKKLTNVKCNKNKENIIAEKIGEIQPCKTVNSLKKPLGTVIHKVKLFNHLYFDTVSLMAENKLKINSERVHPAFIKFGIQMRTCIVVGSNARCLAFLCALKQTISDFLTPEHKQFSRSFEEHLGPAIDYLNTSRPFSVSMSNAHKYIMWHVKRLPNNISDGQAKEKLENVINNYIYVQIHMAGKAICIAAQNKIANGDVILTYGYSSLVERILTEAYYNNKQFSVIIVDSAPWYEGRQMLHRLVQNDVKCTYVLLSATSFIMTRATKVLLGAHALLANGYVMGRAGSSQIALVAKHFNVPVLVCCETYKFTERVQTDSIVYNELGNAHEVMPKEQWLNNRYLTPLCLRYDVTTPDLITAVVTEIAILPCTSVPVVLRVRPNEYGTYNK